MRRIVQSIIVGGAVCFLATASLFAQSIEETWQVSITGHDRGVAFLTFTNDFTFAGYGISLEALGPFTMTGTWTNNPKGFQGAFTGASASPENGIYTAKLNNNGFVMKVTHSTIGSQTFKAPVPALPPTVHNEWFDKGTAAGTKYLASFTLAASTNNMPGWFDLTGGGTGGSQAGSFTMSGAVLVTSDLDAAAYVVIEYGGNVVSEQAALFGHLAHNGKRLVLVGKDKNGKIVTLHATTNP